MPPTTNPHPGTRNRPFLALLLLTITAAFAGSQVGGLCGCGGQPRERPRHSLTGRCHPHQAPSTATGGAAVTRTSPADPTRRLAASAPQRLRDAPTSRGDQTIPSRDGPQAASAADPSRALASPRGFHRQRSDRHPSPQHWLAIVLFTTAAVTAPTVAQSLGARALLQLACMTHLSKWSRNGEPARRSTSVGAGGLWSDKRDPTDRVG